MSGSPAAAIQPFANLDPDTENALRASIKKFGVVVPIVVDRRGRIIDGHHRARLAKELNLTCPQVVRNLRDDDDANALAYSLNADRRHMTREDRIDVVTHLREQGYSLRAIAGAVGVSAKTVFGDLTKAAGVTPVTPAEPSQASQPSQNTEEDGEVGNYTFAPAVVDAETGEVTDIATGETKGRITGMDGKSYPKKREPKDPTRTKEGQAAKWAKVAEMAAAGYTSRQCAEAVGHGLESIRESAKERGISFPADEATGANNMRRIDPNRVVAETVATVEGAAFGLSLVVLNTTDLDRESLSGWVSSLSESLRSLTTLRNNLKKELTRA